MTDVALHNDSDLRPWEQLPGETNKAYDRFVAYLEMGPDRSLDKVRQKYTKNTSYKRYLAKWSSEHNWVKRAEAYDRHQIKKDMENREEARELVRQKILNRAGEAADRLIDIALGKELATKDQVKAILAMFDKAGITDVEASEGEVDRRPQGTLYQQINHFYQQDK
nr:hypothetical protein 34 [Balneolaceae bacterium]